MELIETPLKDCFVIKMDMFGDGRGFFLEVFNKKDLRQLDVEFEVKQINFAKSQKNVLRGLHFQKDRYAQAKIVGVVTGSVLDVVVDLRNNSPTFLKHYKLKLSSPDTMLLVPKGFAHGYYTLQDETIFYYAVDDYYNPDHEGGIKYDDSTLAIDWELDDKPIVSEKDLNQPLINK